MKKTLIALLALALTVIPSPASASHPKPKDPNVIPPPPPKDSLTLRPVAPPSYYKPWTLKGEKGHFWWDITPDRSYRTHLVINGRNARVISPGRLRVEISIRAHKTSTLGQRTYQPSVIYDELTRCDNGAVCDPPLYPVVSYYRAPGSLSRYYYTVASGKWYTHSMTIDCREGGRRAYGLWQDGKHQLGLNLVPVCRAYGL